MLCFGFLLTVFMEAAFIPSVAGGYILTLAKLGIRNQLEGASISHVYSFNFRSFF